MRPADEAEFQAKLYALILMMIVIWSANFIIGKFILREMPPLLVVGIRMALAAVAMVPIYFLNRYRTGRPGWVRQDVPLLLGLGIVGVGLNQVFFVNGLSRTTVGHASLMIGLTPVCVLTLAALSGQEKMSVARLIGMLLALSGVAVLQFGPQETGRTGAKWAGDLLVFAGAFTFAVFTVVGKATMGRVEGVVVNTFAYVGTGVALLPLTISLSRTFDFSRITLVGWSSLLYMSICPSVIAYLIYYYALARIPASQLSAFTYLQPLLATLMAIPALGEYPTASLLVGGVMILAGVFVAERL